MVRKVLIRSILLFLLLAKSSFLLSQSLGVEQTIEDLQFLKDKIKKYNPALIQYNPNFEENAKILLKEVESDYINLVRYFDYVSQLCALSNEGHFAVGNRNDKVYQGILQNRYSYLPIIIKTISNQVYIWNDFSEEQFLEKGDRILSINKKPIGNILGELKKSIPSDGAINTYLNKQLDIGFHWMYLLYVEQSSTFDIEVENLKGEKFQYNIKALTNREQAEIRKRIIQNPISQQSLEAPSFHTFSIEKNNAYLKLPSFSYRRIKAFKVKSKKLYKEIFKKLNDRQIKSLTIDLRGNTGGRYEFAYNIVPYILLEEANATFLKKSISWEGKEKIYKIPKPSKISFKGEIFVLVDGKTFSSASAMARYLKEYANATIIGEETGSRYEGFVAGSKEFVVLPNSHIEIGIPRYHTIFPKSEKQKTQNRGLLPDYVIEYTIQDLIDEKDLHMKKVNVLIEK